jgi:hypothetical protein
VTALPAAQARELVIRSASGYLPGVPILLRVEVRDDDGRPDRGLWDAEVDLTIAGPGGALAPARVRLWNGLGTALVAVTPPPGAADVTLEASAAGLTARRILRSLAAVPAITVSGDTPADAEWSGVVRVAGPVTVPAGRTLRVLPGTLVLVDGVVTQEGQPGECRSLAETPSRCGVSITVQGALESLGTEEDPVVITAADPARAWGRIDHDDGAPSLYRHTHITRAGNSPRGGHTNTGAAIRCDETRVIFESCVVADTAGKSMAANGADLELRDCVLSRSVMGPEIDGTALLLLDSYLLEFYGTDDNDGIYLHSQQIGQDITLSSSVIAGGNDDAIDTLGSSLAIVDCIVRDFNSEDDPDTKGISIFSGEADVHRCIVAGNKVGLSAKGQNGDGAVVRIDRSTMVGNGVAVQAEDKFGEPDLKILISVASSILRGNPPGNSVVTDYPPEDIAISYSNVGESWPGEGNQTADPELVDPAGHDFRLQATSTCIDAGDPAAPADADGTRADMGALPHLQSGPPRFRRGDVNGDSSIDIADPVGTLLYLFAGNDLPCARAADSDGDGIVGLTDVIRLLAYLFRDGLPPAPPGSGCGTDPTPDALRCDASTCP